MKTAVGRAALLVFFAAVCASPAAVTEASDPTTVGPAVESVDRSDQLQEHGAADLGEVRENGKNATEIALADLAAVESAMGQEVQASSLRGWWGHGKKGETCCMCSKHVGFTTLLYAAGDYSHRYGKHSARWRCNQVCELQCHLQGGHKFGCYGERKLLAMEQSYGHRIKYHILHKRHYGNIC